MGGICEFFENFALFPVVSPAGSLDFSPQLVYHYPR